MSIQFSDDVVAQKFFDLCEDMSTIKESLRDYPETKRRVEKHEQIVKTGKWLTAPLLIALQTSVHGLLKKVGL